MSARPSAATPAARAGDAALRAQADAAARREAVRRFHGCVALEAGAGTGKTTVLVNRVVAWCVGEGFERAEKAEGAGALERAARLALRGVVAITFTEAAAAEMAHRIGEALRAVGRGELPVGLDPDAVPGPELAAARARALLADLDQLVVQSIHAWCRRILARHPLEAGLHPRFEVDGDGAGQRTAVRAALRDALTAAFAAGPEGDLVELCLGDASAEELEATLVALVGEGVSPALFDADPFAPERIAALLADLRDAARALLDAEAGRLAGMGVGGRVAEATRVLLDALEAAPPSLEGLAAVAGAAAEQFQPNLLERLRAWRRGQLGRQERDALGGDEPALAEAAGTLRRRVEHVIGLDPARLGRARRVTGALLADVEARLRRDGLVPFATLLRATRELFERHPAVAALERRRIDQLLVDEFQDTDPIQCRIVEILALEGPADERPGLFLVGDPKQSIYGWRSADLAAYEGFLGRALRGEAPLRLARNRRSPPEVLEEVERAVEPVMRAEPGVQPRFEPLLEDPERTLAALAHPVEAWVCYEPDDARAGGRPAQRVGASRRLEAETLARDLRRLHEAEGVAWADCAVLLRTASDLDEVLEALREGGVPFAVESDRSYYRRREVLDACALVRSVLDPNDALALVAWLRSPAVGVPDAAWLPLFAAGLPRLAREVDPDDAESVARLAGAVRGAAAALPEGVPGLAGVAGFEESLVAALCDLARLRASFEAEAPDRFVERLRRTVLVEASESARHLGSHRLARLERFLRELLRWLEDGVADAASVARALREAAEREPDPFEGPPRSPEGDAVRVMTVHRAKGLDFHHVYLLSIEKLPGRTGRPDTAVCRPDEPPEYRLFGASTPGYERLRALRERRGDAEEVRTLYVALTRARRRVVVSGRFARDARPLADSRTFAELLRHRRGGLPDLAAELVAAEAAGRSEVALDGVLWRFPALEARARAAGGGAPEPDPASGEPDLASAGEMAAASARLARLGAEARARARRPRSRGAAPEEDAGRAELGLAARLGSEAASGTVAPRPRAASRAAALAIGTALHAVLERLDPAEPPGPERARAAGVVAAVLRRELGPGRAAAAAGREARRLLDAFFEGPLHGSLRRLAPHVVARELPVLLAPSDAPGAPVGSWSGVADLVYRDPRSGELVIADYKSDRVGAEGAGALALAYREQGRVYARALQAALGLPALPRFELWLLDAGRIEPVPLEDSEAPA